MTKKNTLTKSQEKRIRKELKDIYDTAGSTDDRSDVECLIDGCIWKIEELLSKQKKEY